MIEEQKFPNIQTLINDYFTDSSQIVNLRKGDVLLLQGQFNDRLYLVRKGELSGNVEDLDGNRYKIFSAVADMFVGVYSYFSNTFLSIATVVAEKDSKLAYINRSQTVTKNSKSCCLAEEFMPVIVSELVYRQQRVQEIAIEKEHAIKKLMQAEKLASLGQMAAGIAHELNNAIAVLKRNTEWIRDELSLLWKQNRPDEYRLFEHGLNCGRTLSGIESRKKTRELGKTFAIDDEQAEKFAQFNFPRDRLKKIIEQYKNSIDAVFIFWEAGATLHDMLIAINHSVHVLNSVRALGAAKSTRQPDQDINASIKETLSLLHNSIKRITVQLNLESVQPIEANKGELVQIWTNILKNACESLISSQTKNPVILISSKLSLGFGVKVIFFITSCGKNSSTFSSIFVLSSLSVISSIGSCK